MTDELTRPERFTEIAQAIEKKKVVHVAHGCAVCVNRAWTFHGQGFCRVQSLTFPRCLEADAPLTFAPDDIELRRRQLA